MKSLSVIVVLLVLAAGSLGQACAIWNQGVPGGDTLVDYSNTNYHVNGLHWGDAWETGSCSYQNTSNRVGSPCIGTIRIYDSMTMGESGDVVGNYHHVGATQDSGASQTREFPQGTSATAYSSVGFAACPIQLCNVTVSLMGAVTVTPNTAFPIWGTHDTFDTYCPAETMGCPLIIDTIGEGIQLTDALDGVVTDMVIPGQPTRFGWTKKGSHNGFLWVDGHLFGNQMGYSDGYAMLAHYDVNGDGVVDKKDGPAFDTFRVWIDANHDGIVQPEELHTLASLGLTSIPLAHNVIKTLDASGNLVYDKGTINTKAGTQTMIDAFLATDLTRR